MPTNDQGFNVPFARTFLYGNITKDWTYQVGTQGFLGSSTCSTCGWPHFGDWLTLRAGKGLTPPLYEYYAFSPALEPVITNSPLFQLAGKRQSGVMSTGNILDNRVQYWSGVNNSRHQLLLGPESKRRVQRRRRLTPFKGAVGETI